MRTWRLSIAMLCMAAVPLAGCAASPPKTDIPTNSWSVRDVGAVGDGKTNDTAAFQKALDQCKTAGWGTVVVPAGDYLIGSIVLGSNTTLNLEKGANLIGSPDPADYPIVDVRWEGRWVKGHRALISADHAQNIRIVGPGHVEGNPAVGTLRSPRGPVLIEPVECDFVYLADFSTHQTRMWSIHPTYCRNVVAERLTIRSETGNGDGIDVDSCNGVNVDRCDIQTGDDPIALKSGRGMEGYKIARPCENITITRCSLGDSIFAGIGIGSETSGGVRHVNIDHCKFTHVKTYAIYIKSRTDRGGSIVDINGDDLDVLSATGGFLRVNLTSSGREDPEPVVGLEGIPQGRVFCFTNVRVSCGTLIDATGISPKKPLSGLMVMDVTGDCQKGISLANVMDAELREIHVHGYSGPFLQTDNVKGIGVDGAVPYKAPPAAPKTKAQSRPG